MADVDFRTDLTTVAPPVGRFSFRQGVSVDYLKNRSTNHDEIWHRGLWR